MRIFVCVTLCIIIARSGALGSNSEEPSSNRRDQRFYTEAEARVRAFGDISTWHDTLIVVDSAARQELYGSTRYSEGDTTVRLHFALDDSGILAGVYRIAREVGKYAPFEFLVAMGPDLKVTDVIVLTYRESRGGEVRRSRFLRQYRGKSAKSPVRLNRDVIGIAGATLSAQAVNRGVKKALWWAHKVWGPVGSHQ